jgi:hypothetical protein
VTTSSCHARVRRMEVARAGAEDGGRGRSALLSSTAAQIGAMSSLSVGHRGAPHRRGGSGGAWRAWKAGTAVSPCSTDLGRIHRRWRAGPHPPATASMAGKGRLLPLLQARHGVASSALSLLLLANIAKESSAHGPHAMLGFPARHGDRWISSSSARTEHGVRLAGCPCGRKTGKSDGPPLRTV